MSKRNSLRGGARKAIKGIWNRRARNLDETNPRALRIMSRRFGGLWVERRGPKGRLTID